LNFGCVIYYDRQIVASSRHGIAARACKLVGLPCTALAVLAFAAPALAATEEPAEASSQCTEAQPPPAPTLRSAGVVPPEKVVLRAEPQQLSWTFHAKRDEVALPVVIEATPPLTGTAVSAIQITPDAVALIRADRSETLPKKATHTPPKISRHGERITFDICVDPDGARAGKYTGVFFVDGPRNVSGAKLELVVTTRSQWWLMIGSLIALFAVVAVLTLKGVADYKKEISGTTKQFRWPEALRYIWSPAEGRLFTSLVGIVTATLVGFGLYNSDPTWGDDWYADIVTLAGAAITAVGAQGILDGLRGTVTRST
jgi:hypothetical protein